MWPDQQEIANLMTFTAEILNGKLHFLCSVIQIYCHATLMKWAANNKEINIVGY